MSAIPDSPRGGGGGGVRSSGGGGGVSGRVTPIISAGHNFKSILTRIVDMVNGQPVVNDSPNIPPFYTAIIDPRSPRVTTGRAFGVGGSPRQAIPGVLRHATGLTGPSLDLRAGYRVNVLSYGLLELLNDGTPLSTGVRTPGFIYAFAPVAWLYPLSGILSDMDGNPISNMNLGIWGALESHDVTAGEFEDYQGEAPIEFLSSLQRNVDIMVGTTRYRVTAAEPDFGVMTVHLRLRKADEPLAP